MIVIPLTGVVAQQTSPSRPKTLSATFHRTENGRFETTEFEVSPRAHEVLATLKKEHPEVVVLLDESSCCSVSNVFALKGKPPWEAEPLGTYDSIPIYIHPELNKSLGRSKVLIDAFDFADDSLSLETDYGKRLVMMLSVGIPKIGKLAPSD